MTRSFRKFVSLLTFCNLSEVVFAINFRIKASEFSWIMVPVPHKDSVFDVLRSIYNYQKKRESGLKSDAPYKSFNRHCQWHHRRAHASFSPLDAASSDEQSIAGDNPCTARIANFQSWLLLRGVSGIGETVRIGPTGSRGYGVFCLRDVREGEVIALQTTLLFLGSFLAMRAGWPLIGRPSSRSRLSARAGRGCASRPPRLRPAGCRLRTFSHSAAHCGPPPRGGGARHPATRSSHCSSRGSARWAPRRPSRRTWPCSRPRFTPSRPARRAPSSPTLQPALQK